jgi:hypothetical protein
MTVEKYRLSLPEVISYRRNKWVRVDVADMVRADIRRARNRGRADRAQPPADARATCEMTYDSYPENSSGARRRTARQLTLTEAEQ